MTRGVEEAPEVKFERFVNKTDTCWHWTGSTHSDGHPTMFCSFKNINVRRWAFMTSVCEEIPGASEVIVTCENKLCVNPAHLDLRVRGVKRRCCVHDCERDASVKGRCIRHYQVSLMQNLQNPPQMSWADKHPDRRHAQKTLQDAIKWGRIRRPTICERCATKCKPDGSHFDYTKPLYVEWLCKSCHVRKDQEIRRTTGYPAPDEVQA